MVREDMPLLTQLFDAFHYAGCLAFPFSKYFCKIEFQEPKRYKGCQHCNENRIQFGCDIKKQSVFATGCAIAERAIKSDWNKFL